MKLFLYMLTIGFFVVTSCEKIIAEDITNETPVLVFPTMNDTVQQNPVYFKWKEMAGASKYRLEIASPSFANMNAFVLDSIIVGTDFLFALDSNEYELRLTATNGAYDSKPLGPIKFWVGVSASGGTGGQVVLLTPEDGGYRNASFDKKFMWENYPNFTSYEFSLRAGASFETGTVLSTVNAISGTQLNSSHTFTEGVYSWGVKAYTSTGETTFSKRSFSIDLTDPNTASLTSPADNNPFFSVNSFTFTWSNGSDVGTIQSPVISRFEIDTVQSFNSASLYSLDVQGSSTVVNLSNFNNGVYYWRVVNRDAAGNEANASSIRQFTIN